MAVTSGLRHRGPALLPGPDGWPRPGRAGGPLAVVGAAGFLGSALVAAARRAGLPVAAYTRATPFRTPAGAPDDGLLAAGTVFWLASGITPAVAEADPDRVRADLAAFTSLLRAVRTLPDPPRVVLLSSGGTIYDPAAPPPYRETSPVRPRTAYGRAKRELEAALRRSRLPAGRAVAVRVSNVYGPGQPAVSGQGVVGHWLRAVAAGEPLVVYGDPGTVRDYVYVGDVAHALLAVHRAPALPPVLNVGSGAGTSLGELSRTVREVVGDPPPRCELRPARGFDGPHTWLDVTLAAEVLGWAPATPLRDGLAAAWQSVRRLPVGAGAAASTRAPAPVPAGGAR
jgi:UDP-glucose 4-epimerase